LKYLLIGCFLLGSVSHALEVISFETKTINGRKVDFEVASSGTYPLRIHAEGGVLEVLNPRFFPRVVTDGTHFFEIGSGLEPLTRIEIKPGGGLVTTRLADGKVVKPGDTARAQIASFLFPKDRAERNKVSPGVENFLVETENLDGKKIFEGGFTAGSKLLLGTDKYTVLGGKRYPRLLQKGTSLFNHDKEAKEIYPVGLIEGQLTFAKDKTRIKAPAELERAYLNLSADHWSDYDDNAKKRVRQFFKSYLQEKGPGVAIDSNTMTYPYPMRKEAYVDEEGKPLNEAQIKTRMLNFVLNLLSTNPKARPARVLKTDKGERVDLGEFLSPDVIARLITRNPYACGTDDNMELRLDWLISTLMTDSVYREFLELPPTLAGLEKKLGVNFGFVKRGNGRENVAAPISGVGHAGRVANVQPQKNHPELLAYGTQDFSVNEKNELTNPKGDFRKHPTDFVHDGGEFIWEKPNRYPEFALYFANGTFSAAAPDSLVDATNADMGPFIKNPVSCLNCHQSMMRSPDEGTMQSPEDFRLTKEEFAKDPDMVKRFKTYEAYAKVIDENYSKLEAFMGKAEKTKGNFHLALGDSKAFVAKASDASSPIALLPEVYKQYRSTVSLRDAARELGTTYEELMAVIPPNRRVSSFPEQTEAWATGDKFEREQFELVYCELKERLAAVGKDQVKKKAH